MAIEKITKIKIVEAHPKSNVEILSSESAVEIVQKLNELIDAFNAHEIQSEIHVEAKEIVFPGAVLKEMLENQFGKRKRHG